MMPKKSVKSTLLGDSDQQKIEFGAKIMSRKDA